MCTIDKINKLISLLQNALASDTFRARLDKVVAPMKSYTKWSCYSDYCLFDPNKPNSAMSFVLIPYESEQKYQQTKEFIHTKQPKDLKQVKKHVNSDFLSFLRNNDIISFGFIMDDFTKWMGENKDEQREALKECLSLYQNMYAKWADNAANEDLKSYYSAISIQLQDITTKKIKDKEINTYIEILFVSIVGAVSISEIAKRLDNVEILGWFSDRDALLDKGQGLVCNIMHATLYCILSKNYQFPTYNLDSTHKPFFDDFNRVSDIITGTLADYNIKTCTASKPKFLQVLKEYFADNESASVHQVLFAKGININEIRITLTAPDQP